MRFITLFALSPFWALAQNQTPEITNLAASANLAEGILTIQYDLVDIEDDLVEVFLEVSDNDGNTFLIDTENATGDIGFPVTPGTGKEISWIYVGRIDSPGDYVVKLVADDRFQIDIQELVDQVDSNRLRTDLEYLCGIRHRTAGLAHLQEVQDTLEQLFLENQLQTNRQGFPFGAYQGQNIIGRLQGTVAEDTVYIVDAHYDTVNNSPGADDNASGLAGVMEAVRILSNYNFKKSIKFIGFDLEEDGLVGSNWYVNLAGPPDYETNVGAYNFEMIGYFDTTANSQTLPPGFELLFPAANQALIEDQFRGNFITNVGISSFADFAATFDNAAATYVPGLKVLTLVAPDALVPPDLARSDHARFWEAGLPAIMLTDGANFRNINYHTPEDEFNSLNYTFMSQVIQATIAAVAESAEIQHSSTAETTVSITTSVSNTLDCNLRLISNTGEETLQIQLEHCTQKPELVQLFSVNGQLLRQYNVVQEERISLSTIGLPDGLYLLKLIGEKGQLVRKVVL